MQLKHWLTAYFSIMTLIALLIGSVIPSMIFGTTAFLAFTHKDNEKVENKK